jgi:hypothetical protein
VFVARSLAHLDGHETRNPAGSRWIWLCVAIVGVSAVWVIAGLSSGFSGVLGGSFLGLTMWSAVGAFLVGTPKRGGSTWTTGSVLFATATSVMWGIELAIERFCLPLTTCVDDPAEVSWTLIAAIVAGPLFIIPTAAIIASELPTSADRS